MENKFLKKGSFITIQDWMVEELGLSKNNLLVFAIIYGFSQDGNSWFEGSREYLSKWCGATDKGIDKNLKKLLECNLIIKQDVPNGRGHFCKYKCNLKEISQNRLQVNFDASPSESGIRTY